MEVKKRRKYEKKERDKNETMKGNQRGRIKEEEERDE